MRQPLPRNSVLKKQSLTQGHKKKHQGGYLLALVLTNPMLLEGHNANLCKLLFDSEKTCADPYTSRATAAIAPANTALHPQYNLSAPTPV